MMTVHKLVKNSDTPWACMKSPDANLVYWIHSKCACSFYRLIFNKLNWQYVTTDEINWSKDLVFSYIRQPLTKHRVGIIEYFYYNKCLEILDQNKDNDNFFNMLANAAYLDVHSMSINERLGPETCLKIKWIPIDCHGVDHVQETLTMLDQHVKIKQEVRKWIVDLKPYHVSQGEKKQYNERMLKIPPSPLIIKSLEFDQWLYDQVTIKSFEPDTYAIRIRQLRNSGMTQEQAEVQADKEVETSEYLKWDLDTYKHA